MCAEFARQRIPRIRSFPAWQCKLMVLMKGHGKLNPSITKPPTLETKTRSLETQTLTLEIKPQTLETNPMETKPLETSSIVGKQSARTPGQGLGGLATV